MSDELFAVDGGKYSASKIEGGTRWLVIQYELVQSAVFEVDTDDPETAIRAAISKIPEVKP